MSKYRHLMSTEDKAILRKTIFHLIEKIVIDKETVEVHIDLTKYFNVSQMNGVNELILRVKDDRNLIANKPKYGEINFTSQKLIEAFQLMNKDVNNKKSPFVNVKTG